MELVGVAPALVFVFAAYAWLRLTASDTDGAD